VLDVVRELERRDAAAAAAIAAASELERSLNELRSRAATTAELLARLPAERERVAAAREGAAAALGAAREALAAADEEGALDARRALELAESGLAEAEAAVAAVERDGDAAEGERDRIDLDTRAAAARLAALERVHEVEPPAPGLAGALDWTSRARAAVFVVRSGLELERERIVREAEELGAALLGEQVYTVKALVERVSATGGV
jgi:chromosome segregation ATPase